MSYQQALQAAGADVQAFEHFGSYQGEWIAKIGEDQYLMGYYGSCSGCDAFEAEFEFSDYEEAEYDRKLAEFGHTYLDGQPYSKLDLLARFKEQGEWDSDAQAVINWLTTGEGK